MLKWINTLCAVSYELAFVLVVVLALLAPIHALFERHLVVAETLSDTSALVRGDVRGLEVGDEVPLYRFNYQWKTPIGSSHVSKVGDGEVLIDIDEPSMSWPLGIHGKLVRGAEGPYAELARVFEPGEQLHIFSERKNVGAATITSVAGTKHTLSLPDGLPEGELVVSEFSYATAASHVASRLLSATEALVLFLALTLYGVVYAYSRERPLLRFGRFLRSLSVPRAPIFWLTNLAVGIPFSWFLGTMPLYLGAYLLGVLAPYFGSSLYLSPYAAYYAPSASIAVGIAYYVYLFWYRKSPVLAFWHFISYKGRSGIERVSFARGLTMWALHLTIVYAFGWTLLGFLVGDLQAAISYGWPPRSLEDFFSQSKFIIWALTVVGVLIGYGYSVVSILWGRYIRNLDFTITGWLTNGFCYPFLGVVIWQMVPSFTGTDPIITAGPLLYLMLVAGFLLNFLYMLSIWNLWTLFDLMADKGVRTSGFYSVVRHPNYALESAMFFATELVGLSAGIHWLGIAVFFFLYWIRSEREDNFMGYSNPMYEKYRESAPYKFIPGIY